MVLLEWNSEWQEQKCFSKGMQWNLRVFTFLLGALCQFFQACDCNEISRMLIQVFIVLLVGSCMVTNAFEGWHGHAKGIYICTLATQFLWVDKVLWAFSSLLLLSRLKQAVLLAYTSVHYLHILQFTLILWLIHYCSFLKKHCLQVANCSSNSNFFMFVKKIVYVEK